jgi:hypothetical protein
MSDDQPPDQQDNEPGPGSSEPPIRVCPTCSAQSRTDSDTCPHCGASFIRSRRLRTRKRIGAVSKRKKIVVAGIIIGLLVGGVAAGAIAKINHDNQVAQEEQEEQEARELALEEREEEEEELAEERESEEELEELESEFAKESVGELEDAITEDANGEAEEGYGEYVSETSCEAEGGRVDPTLAAQDFNCLAVTDEEGTLQEGYRYSGTINYAKGSYTWRLGGP